MGQSYCGIGKKQIVNEEQSELLSFLIWFKKHPELNEWDNNLILDLYKNDKS